MTRLGALAVVLLTGAWVVHAAIPKELMQKQLHRARAVEAATSLPTSYAGTSACVECHELEYEDKQGGYHQNLACETCHGAAANHVADPNANTPFVPKKRGDCVRCHAFDPARPTGFPQINPTLHNPLKPCLECHDAHSPKPKEPPRDCSACHGAIARTKAVSPHGLLECTVCHEVPEEHKMTPRTVWAKKPTAREFCLGCHGADAKPEAGTPGATAPHVPSEHGRRYLCWQCHYPHMPELSR